MAVAEHGEVPERGVSAEPRAGDVVPVGGGPEGGARYAGGRSTPPRAAVEDDPGREREPPERMVLVPLLMSAGSPGTEAGATRCLLVRLRGAERASLLSLPAPAPGETLFDVVGGVLQARLGLRPIGEPRLVAGRVAARLPQARRGAVTQGWLRAVVVRAEGETVHDVLVDEVLALPPEEAARALPTDAERRLLTFALE